MSTEITVLDQIQAGTHDIIPLEGLTAKLARGTPLIIKFGADPTASDLHLGHAVVLSKLRLFQDLGHTVIFLIGDFTARIGDPTGRSKTRPALTEEEIAHHTQTYVAQVTKILDPRSLQVRFNSQWLDTLTSRDWVRLCGQVTVSRIIERDDFHKRLTTHQPIGMHELLYPLMQGYDSVVLNADVELGGTDQTFNMLMGRHLQEAAGKEGQVILTMPLLEGLDGVHKMSKSYGNTIGLNEPADQAYGKIMSISDTLMWRYYQLLLNTTNAELAQMQMGVQLEQLHPMNLKKDLARRIIQRFWGAEEAVQAQHAFEASFQQRTFDHAQEVSLAGSTHTVIDLVKVLGGADSSSQARRLIQDGAVSINGEKVRDVYTQVTFERGDTIKIGKHRLFKVI